MAKDAIELSSADLSKLYVATRKVDKDVAKALRKRLSKTAKPIVDEVRQAVLNTPSKSGVAEKAKRGETGVGLRRAIAASTQTKINPSSRNSFSIRIRVSGSKFNALTGKYRTLPRYLEGLSKRKWRHPVFAQKGSTKGAWQGAWVEQEAHPYLLPTVMKHKQEVREEVVKSFIDALDELQIRL